MSPVVKYYFKTILLGFAFFLTCDLVAQERVGMDFAVSTFGYREQIGSRITKVVQDTLGFYWLASWEGIYHFNGRQARLYDLPYLKMKANNYFKLDVDANGMFWYYSRENPSVGFRVAEVRIFDPYRKKTWSLDKYLPDLPFDPQAITYIVSQGNRILMGVNDREIYEFGTDGIQHLLSLPQGDRILDLGYYAAGTSYFVFTSSHLLQFAKGRPARAVPGLPQSVFTGEVEMSCSGDVIVFYEKKNRELIGLYFPAVAEFEQVANIKFLGCDQQGTLCLSSQKHLRVLKTSRPGNWNYSLEAPFDELFSEEEIPENVTFLNGDLWTFFHNGGKIIRPRTSLFTNYLEYRWCSK